MTNLRTRRAGSSNDLLKFKSVEDVTKGFSEPSALKPTGYTQEVCSAVSMFFPLLYGFWFLWREPGGASWFAWLILVVHALHLPFSIAYHACCARIASGEEVDDTPYRCLDQSGIHVIQMAYFWAFTRSAGNTAAFALPWNVYCISMLWLKAKTEARHWRFVRIGVSTALSLAPLFLAGAWATLLGCALCAGMGAVFFISDILLCGWGHPLMHVIAMMPRVLQRSFFTGAFQPIAEGLFLRLAVAEASGKGHASDSLLFLCNLHAPLFRAQPLGRDSVGVLGSLHSHKSKMRGGSPGAV